MTVNTELVWAYEPPDYFESPLHTRLVGAAAVFDGGTALATLDTPSPNLPTAQRTGLADEVEAVLLARQLLTHRPYRLAGPHLVQHHADGGRQIVLVVSDAVAVASASCELNVVLRDAEGQVIRDPRAERQAREVAFVTAFAPKLTRSPILRALVQSYAQAVRDPGDELTHLYEIRDALAAYYGGDHKAQRALLPAGVTRADWSRLGMLANTLPLAQGRHRGEAVGALRPATNEELRDARALARKLIEAFAVGV